MFKFTVISILILCVFYSYDAAPATQSLYSLYAQQKLQPREGYVPVYIRFGDTPLFAINPDLAAAFEEAEIALNKIESNKKDFVEVNGSSENTGSKERKDNAIINTLQDENSAKDIKKNEKIKNVD